MQLVLCLQLPITTDYESAKLFLQALNTDMLSSQGTAIAEAIDLSKNYYDDENQTNRVLVILSDGEDHEEGAEMAATTAANEGITIFTIALGTEKGDVIPLKQKRSDVFFQKRCRWRSRYHSNEQGCFTNRSRQYRWFDVDWRQHKRSCECDHQSFGGNGQSRV